MKELALIAQSACIYFNLSMLYEMIAVSKESNWINHVSWNSYIKIRYGKEKKRKEKMINDAMLGLNLFMHRSLQRLELSDVS